MNLDSAKELLAYNTWANRQIVDAVARLEASRFSRNLGGSFPSVQATLTHRVWAEWLWLERWQDRSPKDEVWEYALWRQIYHLFNPSTYHRGQVTHMLRLLDTEPVATDVLVFWDEGR